jgi:hypothetical protein
MQMQMQMQKLLICMLIAVSCIGEDAPLYRIEDKHTQAPGVAVLLWGVFLGSDHCTAAPLLCRQL